jgi:hypothetical protein
VTTNRGAAGIAEASRVRRRVGRPIEPEQMAKVRRESLADTLPKTRETASAESKFAGAFSWVDVGASVRQDMSVVSGVRPALHC